MDESHGGAEAQNATEEAHHFDFSELPDVAWVRILNYLPLMDRFRASETCHRLNGMVNHPSLWSVYTVHFWGEADSFSRRRARNKATMSYSQAQIVKRFGKYFQHLKMIVHGHLREMGRETNDIISEIATECRLETLTLNAGSLTSILHTIYGSAPRDTAVLAFVSFVKNAHRMKHLHVRSWPMYVDMDTPELNIFRAVTENQKLRDSLESFVIFGIDDEQWSEREPVLLSALFTQEVVSAFNNLTTLGLRSTMLSEELLLALAEPHRVKLQTLQIFVHYQPASSDFKIPHIRSRAWDALVSRNSKFRVECTVLLTVPDAELANMLTPEVPVSVFKVLRYAKFDPWTLARLYTHYSKTLRSFICFSDAECQDDELLKLVTRCRFLDEFVYHGGIRSATVVTVAKHRGANWKKLEVKSEGVKMKDAFEDVDDDQVLSHGPDGELVLVALMRFHQPEGARQATIEHMTADVSKALDVPWRPV